jgi:DDE superfamily endonuclease
MSVSAPPDALHHSVERIDADECAHYLAVHKQPEVRRAIEQVGALVRFLPPYSPDFNPIELAFAKLKAFLRAARPRNFDQVCSLIAVALELFTPDECAAYARHCGCRATP